MSRRDEEPVVVECSIMRESEKALLIEMENGDVHWIPLSQIQRTVRNPKGLDEVHMSAWIAGQKGIE